MRVLVIAPHADDETLGVGGTIARRIAEGHQVTVAVVTGHGDQPHPLWAPSLWDGLRYETALAMKALGVEDLRFEELPASLLDHQPVYKTNDVIQRLIADVAPDELFIPFLHDLHRDHHAIAYAALVACRPYLALGKQVRRVLMYETPSETHLFPLNSAPAFVPNAWIDVSSYADKKLDAWSHYESVHQVGPAPRTAAAIQSLLTWRGSQVGVDAAEAFVLTQSLE
jgi:N-acetylglucosamine malate deacetylase 1